jgi:ATP/maltotriose-dependent transcriptional regulator MalT
MKTKPALTHGRDLDAGVEAFQKQAWASAYSHLSAADRDAGVGAEHLVYLAQAALLLGKEVEGADTLARAHQEFLEKGQIQPAVRCAFWLGFTALTNHENAKAGGWLSRANRLLEGESDCVERGYLLLPNGYLAVHGGDPARAYAIFLEAAAVGKRFADKDLMAIALQGQGRALIRQGEVANGLTLLDEAMISVMAGEVSALTAGGVYCSVLEACGEVYDLRRADEWTSALKRWCESQPDLVPYRGHCLVRRAEVLQWRGAWRDAFEEARRACEWLSEPPGKSALGAAYYQLGEIERLRGNLSEAERAYERASQLRPNLGPGLARLRLVQKHVDAAMALVARMAEEVQEPAARATVLDAYVEIALAANSLAAARQASGELSALVSQRGVPLLDALALRSAGAVLLAEGDARGALPHLRQSWNLWCELPAPYEASRVRCLIAQACSKLGDEDNAALELSAARETFEQLGAAADLANVRSMLSKLKSQNGGPLTEREIEVLRLVASGMTNRGIAARLNISEKTVARHLSNIFTKLDLASRTAATAYAYDHGLL